MLFKTDPPCHRFSGVGPQVLAAVSVVNKGYVPSIVGEGVIKLFKVPQCAVAAAPIKKEQLKLTFCSLNVSTKRSDKSVLCCRREFGDETYFWWLQPHAQESAPGFIVPAWSVGFPKDDDQVDMQVIWKEKGGVHVPVWENLRPLKRGERLFRSWTGEGACPDDIDKELVKLARSAKRRKDNDGNDQAAKATKT